MRNQYSASEFIGNAFSLIETKIFYPGARLIRKPAYIRGKKGMHYGKKLTLGHNCRFDIFNQEMFPLHIGDNCEIGDYVHVVASKNVYIGDNVLIASKVFISDTSHGKYSGEDQDTPLTPPGQRKLITSTVKIGNNVWIGENVVILAGSEIGDGCIIGANAIITKNIPENSIVVGTNKIIKQYNAGSKKWEKI